MNRKGQALVEFVIILPVLIMLLMSMVDIGRIIYNKNSLEDLLYDITSHYKNNETYEEIKKEIDKDIDLNITNNNDENVTITITKQIEIITPGLNLFLDGKVEASKVINYE